MRNPKMVRSYSRFVAVAGLGFVMAMAEPPTAFGQGPGGPAGVDVKIRAQNRSVNDTPFCGVGGGMRGDRLDVDVFMDTNGLVTGTATFEDALGGAVDAREEIQKGCLSGARGPHERHEIALLHAERNFLQHKDALRIAAIFLREIFDSDDFVHSMRPVSGLEAEA